MHRILVCDSLHPAGLALFAEAAAEVHNLTPEERPRLPELAAGFDALVVRSTTKVTADLLRAGRRLKVVGRAGIGVDNVDVAAATELGILVVNAPTANLISATEHTFALLLALARRVAAADASVKRGEWDRKSYLGMELKGKTLGIVGFGRIGQQVAERARAFGMRVVAYDPYLEPAVAEKLGAELLPLDDLLARCDVVSLHTPLTAETRNLLSAERLARLKRGALLVNCARGGLVDEAALAAALDCGQLAGAAVDVFAQEPPGSFELARHPRVVATPHIGAQTREAQERIATETARMVLQALDGSLAVSAVNLPFRPAGRGSELLLELSERLGRLASALAEGRLQELKVDLWGIDEALRPAVAVAALKGALAPFLGEGVNYVNAEKLARDREISVVRATHSEPADYPQLVAVSAGSSAGRLDLAGTLFSDRDPRVVGIGGFRLEFRPRGRLLVLRNRDVPGVVGKLGHALGRLAINIAAIHLARREGDPEAMAVLLLDQEPGEAVLEELAAIPEVERVQFVDMG
jgi:D-3-phosphoglycerate dehydrogenase